MNIHEKLKRLREEKEVTQKEVSDFIGVSERVYGYYEKDRFPKDEITLKKLSDYFNVSINYLLGETDIKEKMQTIYIEHELLIDDQEAYVTFAKDAAKEGIPLDDLRFALDIIKAHKDKNKEK